MSATENSPEPWNSHPAFEDRVGVSDGAVGNWCCYVYDAAGNKPSLALGQGAEHAEANAARIVACVNFCAGLPVESMTRSFVDENTELMKAAADKIVGLRERVRALTDKLSGACELLDGAGTTATDDSDWIRRVAFFNAGATALIEMGKL